MLKAEKTVILSDDVYFYTAGYYTQNKWLDNDNAVFVRAKNKRIGSNASMSDENNVELVIYTFSTGKIKPLCNELKSFEDYVVSGSKVYYSTGSSIKCIDTVTGKSEVCFRDDVYLRGPHITADGKYISVYAQYGGKTRIYRINTEEKTGEILLSKAFAPPFWECDHAMVCPNNPDLVFYAHEGTAFYVSNRLWLYDKKTGIDRNIAKQTLNESGSLRDFFGHEMWAPDGKGLYFVKYVRYDGQSETPNGISYVDAASGEHKLLYTGHKFWHVGVSPDGRYLLSDTQADSFKSDVYIVDTETDEEFLLDSAFTDWTHPCHPHPQMSPDNKKVIYTVLNEQGRTSVKIVYLTN